MNLPETDHRDAWMEARVEAYLDDALPADERAVFEARLAAEPVWRDAFDHAARVGAALRSHPLPACPPGLTQAVLEVAWQEARASRRAAWHRRLRLWWADAWQPALAMAMLVAVVVSAALVGRMPAERVDPEVARALEQVKWTLGYLSDVGRRTAESVRDDVLDARVVAPVNRALVHAVNRPTPPVIPESNRKEDTP